MNKHKPTVDFLTDKVGGFGPTPPFKSVQGEIERAKALSIPFAVEVQGGTYATNQDTAKAIIAFRGTCRTPGLHESWAPHTGRSSVSCFDRELNAHLVRHR